MKRKLADGGEVNVLPVVGMKYLLTVVALVATFAQAEAVQANQSPRDPILNDLRYLFLGVNGYESKNLLLPMATSDDHPPYSWRVAILPFLDYVDVPDGYDFESPWDAPCNRSTLEEIPECFTNHQDFDFTPYFAQAPRRTDSCYLAVVDDRTMWPPNRKSNSVARDGPGRTVLIIEAPEMRVPWTEPRDLTFDEAVDLLGKPVRRYANRWFWVAEYYGYQRAVGLLDGHTQKLAPISAEFASAMLTRHGGENIPETPTGEHYLKLEWPKPTYVYKWPRIIGCSVAAAAVGFLFRGMISMRRRRRAANPLMHPGASQ